MAKKKPYAGMNFKRSAIKYCKEYNLGVPAFMWKNKQLYELIKAHKAGNAAEIERLKSANTSESEVIPNPVPWNVRRDQYRAFYDTDDWKRLRYQALVKHGAACQCCGATRADGVKLHVDHIKPRSKYPELELCLDNLQILCEPCNMGKRAWDETDWREQPACRGSVIWVD